MATHSSTLAWSIPWTEEPGGLQSMELQRAGHNCTHTQGAEALCGRPPSPFIKQKAVCTWARGGFGFRVRGLRKKGHLHVETAKWPMTGASTFRCPHTHLYLPWSHLRGNRRKPLPPAESLQRPLWRKFKIVLTFTEKRARCPLFIIKHILKRAFEAKKQ